MSAVAWASLGLTLVGTLLIGATAFVPALRNYLHLRRRKARADAQSATDTTTGGTDA